MSKAYHNVNWKRGNNKNLSILQGNPGSFVIPAQSKKLLSLFASFSIINFLTFILYHNSKIHEKNTSSFVINNALFVQPISG